MRVFYFSIALLLVFKSNAAKVTKTIVVPCQADATIVIMPCQTANQTVTTATPAVTPVSNNTTTTTPFVTPVPNNTTQIKTTSTVTSTTTPVITPVSTSTTTTIHHFTRCRSDRDCPSDGLCINHVCIKRTRCSKDKHCPVGQRCIRKICVSPA